MAYDWTQLGELFQDENAIHLMFDPALINLFYDVYEERRAMLALSGAFHSSVRPEAGHRAMKKTDGTSDTRVGWADLQLSVDQLGPSFIRYMDVDGSIIPTYHGRSQRLTYGLDVAATDAPSPPVVLDGRFSSWLFRRRWPREIWSLANAGSEGQIARFIATNFSSIVTPVAERTLSGRFFQYVDGAWADITTTGVERPDVLSGFGRLTARGGLGANYRTADYFGVWIAHDIWRALNMMRWTGPSAYWSNRLEGHRLTAEKEMHFDGADTPATAVQFLADIQQRTGEIFESRSASTDVEEGEFISGPERAVGVNFSRPSSSSAQIPGLILWFDSIPDANLHGTGTIRRTGPRTFAWKPPRAADFGADVVITDTTLTTLPFAADPAKAITVTYIEPATPPSGNFTEQISVFADTFGASPFITVISGGGTIPRAYVQRSYGYPHIDDLPLAGRSRTVEFFTLVRGPASGFSDQGDPAIVWNVLNRIETFAETTDLDIRGAKVGNIDHAPTMWPAVTGEIIDDLYYPAVLEGTTGHSPSVVAIVKWDVPGGMEYVADP